jgi:hypothetical protein
MVLKKRLCNIFFAPMELKRRLSDSFGAPVHLMERLINSIVPNRPKKAP